MHHHYITEGIAIGSGSTWVISAAITTMPPYTGSNYFVKWLYAFLHLLGANLDKLHIPGSAADVAAEPKP